MGCYIFPTSTEIDEDDVAGVDVTTERVVVGGLGRALLEQLPLKSPSFLNGQATEVASLAIVSKECGAIASAVRADPFGDGEGDVSVLHFVHPSFLRSYYSTEIVTSQHIFLLQFCYERPADLG